MSIVAFAHALVLTMLMKFQERIEYKAISELAFHSSPAKPCSEDYWQESTVLGGTSVETCLHAYSWCTMPVNIKQEASTARHATLFGEVFGKPH